MARASWALHTLSGEFREFFLALFPERKKAARSEGAGRPVCRSIKKEKLDIIMRRVEAMGVGNVTKKEAPASDASPSVVAPAPLPAPGDKI